MDNNADVQSMSYDLLAMGNKDKNTNIQANNSTIING